MKYLKLFEDFTGEKILYLFDFDETLVETPEFEEAAIAYLNESLSIGEILDNYASRMGITPKDFKIENGKIYIDYIGQDYKQPWILKGKRLYLTAPQYHWTHSPDSLPTGTLELVELYNSVEDKAIITARPEDMRDIIVGKMKELGLEQPKWGLHMFPIRSGSGAPGQWKGDVAVSLIEESGINNVKFYDDKPKIVNRVVRTVKEKLPNVKIEGIRVRSEQLTEEVNMKYLKLYEDLIYDDKEWEIKTLIIYSTYRGISNYYEMINRHFKKYALELVDDNYLKLVVSPDEPARGYNLTEKSESYMEEMKELMREEFQSTESRSLSANQIIILLCLCISGKIMSDFTTATEVRDVYLLSSYGFINDDLTLTKTGRKLAMTLGYELKLKLTN